MRPDRYLISLMKSASLSMRISKHSNIPSNRKMASVISFLSIVPFLDIRSSPPHHLNHDDRGPACRSRSEWLEHYLLLLVVHPWHQAQGHPPCPQLLGITTHTAQVGQV